MIPVPVLRGRLSSRNVEASQPVGFNSLVFRSASTRQDVKHLYHWTCYSLETKNLLCRVLSVKKFIFIVQKCFYFPVSTKLWHPMCLEQIGNSET